MFKKLLLINALNALLVAGASAQTYWLNVVDNNQPVSFPVSSEEACTLAVHHYVRSNLADAISCDVKPLPNALNVRI